MKYTYKMFEDNAGFHHLAIIDDRDECVYYLADQTEQVVKGTLSDLLMGGDPVSESWHGGEDDPQARLAEIEDAVSAGDAWEVEDKAANLHETLRAHQKWLKGEDGDQADLSEMDLSGIDLSGMDLSMIYLNDCDLTGANLRGSSFCGADFRGANLSGADLYGDDLTHAVLEGANLEGANLDGVRLDNADLTDASGLCDPIELMRSRFEQTDRGYIVYAASDGWENLEPDAVVAEAVNFNRYSVGGSGIEAAPLEWMRDKYPGRTIWKCLIEWPWLVGVCVPYNTDGKVWASRVRLLEIAEEGN